ncbi:MAG: cystathionine gamma-synthase [Bacteroidota bacterium]
MKETDRFATRAIHAGQAPDPTTGATITPIYATSTFTQEAPGRHKGYEYSRTGNPTRTALETCLASLEGGAYGLAFASGSAANVAVAHLLSPGDHVVAAGEVYGGTYRLFSKVFNRWGLTVTYVDDLDATAFAAALTERTRLVWLESPTNPLLNVLDIAAIAEIAHGAAGALVAVDNTFATPYLQNPLALGADLVVHSATKYLNGHSDAIGGAVVTSCPKLHEQLRFLQNAAGATLSPFDSWLILRGVKTLAARMEMHQVNAAVVTAFLQDHPAVAKVFYPGLPSHPNHEIARRQMRGWGGMVSFELREPERAETFFRKLRVFAVAESLGGVESLACQPSTMTHASFPRARREELRITPGLVRLSVGLEDGEDLIADLRNALA